MAIKLSGRNSGPDLDGTGPRSCFCCLTFLLFQRKGFLSLTSSRGENWDWRHEGLLQSASGVTHCHARYMKTALNIGIIQFRMIECQVSYHRL